MLDEHLAVPAAGSGMAGLDAYSSINQAIGVLIDGGHTRESAREELHSLASMDDGDLHHAARAILDALTAATAVDPATGEDGLAVRSRKFVI